jgi:tRNA G10  N-methylase Trm11
MSKQKYKFNIVKENYEHYSSGRVIYGASMATNFPVRLTSEIFQQCAEYLKEKGKSSPYTIYDPFCGVGYSLTVLGFIHKKDIKKIYASDSDKTALEFANKNLSLLNKIGLEKRIEELKKLIKENNKTSHREALESAQQLQLKIKGIPIETKIFQYNPLTEEGLSGNISKIDILITDVPYGELTHWEGQKEEVNSIQMSLNKIKNKLNTVSIIAIVLNKKQKIDYEGYIKIKSFTLGKRKIVLLHPLFK